MTFPAVRLCNLICLVAGLTAGISLVGCVNHVPLPMAKRPKAALAMNQSAIMPAVVPPPHHTNTILIIVTNGPVTLQCCPMDTNHTAFNWYYGSQLGIYTGAIQTTNPWITLPPPTTLTFWTPTTVNGALESAFMTTLTVGPCTNLAAGYLVIGVRGPWQDIISVLVNGIVAGSVTNPVGNAFFQHPGQFVQMANSLSGPWTNKWAAPPGGVLSIQRTMQ